MDRLKTMLEYPLDYPKEIEEYAFSPERAAGSNNYIGWLEVVDGEVMFRLFAFRKYKKKETDLTEVLRRMPGEKKWLLKDAYFTYYAGWHIDYGNDDHWYIETDEWFRWWFQVLNIEVLKNTKYKYCGYSERGDLVTYLERYEQEPLIEFFGKIDIYPEKSLVKKAQADKGFCSFLKSKAREVRDYGPQAAICAYNKHLEIKTVYEKIQRKKYIRHKIPETKGTQINIDRLSDYLLRNSNVRCIDYSSYNDYLKALKYLGLDLNDTKNTFPNDFWRMHDLRSEEYESKKDKEDRKKREKLYKDFSQACETHRNMEWNCDGFVIILPTDISDLKKEGASLHHCVGKMGYDVKVAKGESIIAFLRVAGKEDVPYYTIEFSIKQNRIVQCYGSYNSSPDSQIIETIKKWEKIAKEMMTAKTA